jgi:hypothetical protein
MAKIKVTWFSNRHEHSVQWCKLGFMRLAHAGEITLVQIPNELAGSFLPAPLVAPTHRRKAVLTIQDGSTIKTVILDGEDSVFQTSHLIQYCDHYFVCAYRGSFYRGEPFDLGYCWQTEAELAHYQQLWDERQTTLRGYLYKARPFMPIGPDLKKTSVAAPWIQQKFGNLRHRALKLMTKHRPWRSEWEEFEERYDALIRLRSEQPKYDIVLKDSLWGWPRHRIALHQKLRGLADEWNIHSQLSYRDCFDYEYAGFERPVASDFPCIAGKPNQDGYEKMLAASRLAVFATGFHWGCRNIQTLAWFLGNHVYSDPLSFEVPGGVDEFQVSWNTDGSWDDMRSILQAVNADGEFSARKARAAAFDRNCAPQVVARRVLEAVGC